MFAAAYSPTTTPVLFVITRRAYELADGVVV